MTTRVCFVGDDVGPPWNNASSILTRRLIEAVSTRVDCRLATKQSNGWNPARSGLSKVHYAKVTGRPSVDAVRLSVAARLDADVLHLVGTNALFFSPTSKLLGTKARIVRHIFTPYDARDRAIGPIRRVANRLFIDSYAFTTPRLGEWATELSLTTRRYLVRPPIDCDFYKPDEGSPSRDDETILYMGPIMDTRFPYQIVLRAFKRLLLNHGRGRARLVVLTSAMRTSPAAAEKVAVYARQIAIGDRVHVERVDLTEKERIKWYNQASLVIFPYLGSSPEKLADPPFGILEAMASGALVLSSNVLSVSEVLEDGINGFLVPTLSVETLAKTINRALEAGGDAGLRRRAREKIVGEYDYPIVASEMVKAYNDLLS